MTKDVNKGKLNLEPTFWTVINSQKINSRYTPLFIGIEECSENLQKHHGRIKNLYYLFTRFMNKVEIKHWQNIINNIVIYTKDKISLIEMKKRT